eukprot:Opistho-1_new@65208
MKTIIFRVAKWPTAAVQQQPVPLGARNTSRGVQYTQARTLLPYVGRWSRRAFLCVICARASDAYKNKDVAAENRVAERWRGGLHDDVAQERLVCLNAEALVVVVREVHELKRKRSPDATHALGVECTDVGRHGLYREDAPRVDVLLLVKSDRKQHRSLCCHCVAPLALALEAHVAVCLVVHEVILELVQRANFTNDGLVVHEPKGKAIGCDGERAQLGVVAQPIQVCRRRNVATVRAKHVLGTLRRRVATGDAERIDDGVDGQDERDERVLLASGARPQVLVPLEGEAAYEQLELVLVEGNLTPPLRELLLRPAQEYPHERLEKARRHELQVARLVDNAGEHVARIRVRQYADGVDRRQDVEGIVSNRFGAVGARKDVVNAPMYSALI